MTISRILVGVDHSDRSDNAILRAGQIASQHGARILVQHALDIGAAQKLRGLLERVAMEETQERVAKLLPGLEDQTEVLVAHGRPFETLSETKRQQGADLVILGAHRSLGRHASAAAPTAKRLIDIATGPVLIATAPPDQGYQRILVGFDGSAAARQALRFARALAPAAAISAVTAFMIPFSPRNAEPEIEAQFAQETIGLMQRALVAEPSPERITLTARHGEAFGVILGTVRELRPDLLVLGTSMSELYRYVFGGGIVDLIVANPPCDLLVVKA